MKLLPASLDTGSSWIIYDNQLAFLMVLLDWNFAAPEGQIQATAIKKKGKKKGLHLIPIIFFSPLRSKDQSFFEFFL